MEVGAVYNKKRLHGRKYFAELLENIENVPVMDVPRLPPNVQPVALGFTDDSAVVYT